MSWSIFKKQMVSKMKSSSFKTTMEFAEFFTNQYDQCMKRGADYTTMNVVIKGNTELMKQMVYFALESGNQAKTSDFYTKSVSALGKGAVAYWTGAELGKIPPLIPAPGTVLNLSVVSNTVTNPGKWPDTPIPVLPNKESNNPYLDTFILQATIHLQTISGICNTISQYPPILPPGPAVLPWTGYNVPPTPDNPDFIQQIEEQLQNPADPEVEDDKPLAESYEVADFERVNRKKIFRGSPIKRKIQNYTDGNRSGININDISDSSVGDDDQPPPKIYGKIGGFAPPKPPGIGGKNAVLSTGGLVAIERGCSRYGGNYLLHPEAAEQYFKLREFARKKGYTWTITSAYRDLAHQISLGSAKTVAKAGSSPHGWGVAIDFGELFRTVGGSGNPAVNRTGRETSKLYRFLSNVAPDFGWYNPSRLADGFGVDEMWHWEYWGFYT